MKYKSICELYGYPCRERRAVTDAHVEMAMFAYQETTDLGCSEEGIRAVLETFVNEAALDAASPSRPSPAGEKSE